jgi:hypothetical protein
VEATLANPDTETAVLEGLAFKSFGINRRIALHPRAGPDLLARLAKSPDKRTRQNVAINPGTTKEVLLELAPSCAAQFFKNPVFDFLLMEDPDLLFKLPVVVIKNLLKREDCPSALLVWAARFGNQSHQLAMVQRSDLSRHSLQLISQGPHVKAAEIAAGRLISGNFVE